MHVFLVRPRLMQTPHFHACLPCKTQAQAGLHFFTCLSCQDYQTNPPHACFPCQTQCLGKLSSLACFPCESQCLGNLPLACLPYQTQCLGKPPLQVFTPGYRQNPTTLHWLITIYWLNTTLLVQTPYYGFKQYNLDPNNIQTIPSPFHKSFPIYSQPLFKFKATFFS